MKRVFAVAALLAFAASCGPSYNWKAIPVDGHRTGVKATTADNVVEALGTIEGSVYHAPNGNDFEGGCTPELALLLIDAQPAMSEIKQVIGYAPQPFVRTKPECAIYDFAADVVLETAAGLFGADMDVSLLNTGGVRVDIPQGDILMDDICSMFPFANYITFVKLPGWRLREIFEQMAATQPQIIGGARIVVEDHKLVEAEVGGQPVDDDRIYNLATIDFLLNGGDRYYLSKDALSVEVSGLLMRDAILPAVMRYREEGRPFEYAVDGRITVR